MNDQSGPKDSQAGSKGDNLFIGKVHVPPQPTTAANHPYPLSQAEWGMLSQNFEKVHGRRPFSKYPSLPRALRIALKDEI